MKKSTKNTEFKAFQPMTEAQRENANLNAMYYREKAMMFSNTASFCDASEAKGTTATPKEIAKVLKAAQKVRHNPTKPQATVSSIVMVGGVPHKMRDGKLVPMIPAKDSKKWDIVEA